MLVSTRKPNSLNFPAKNIYHYTHGYYTDMRPPRGSTRNSKNIVDEIQATSGTTKKTWSVVLGTDDATLGQTNGQDIAVPTGAKIKQISFLTCWGNITGVSAFCHWSIQKFHSGQASVNPQFQAGDPLRKNILMSGIICIGQFQNASLDIKYKIPKAFQRVADGDTWALVTNSSVNVDTVKQAIYKVFM